jgi:Arc/MetJ family transcription regulator
MTERIHRTSIDLDLDALERAQRILGTTTIRDTVDKALREVDRVAALRRAADLILEGDDEDFVRPEDLVALRHNRHYP